MTGAELLYATLLAVAVGLAGLAIAAPRRLALRLTGLGLAAAFAPLAFLALVELLGRPKPWQLELGRGSAEAATVLASRLDEGRAIHLWLELDGVAEPRAYVLPWHEGAARALDEAQREAEQRGTPVRMRDPFMRSLDDREPFFHAAPQPPLPPKIPSLPAG
jgi:hypothetical protein